MKGLIRNNFYSMESNLMLSFLMACALVFVSLFIKNAAFYPMIIAIQVFLFVVNTGTALHADEVAKWNKFELMLPVKRCTLIGAKYISFLILILCGLIMALGTTIGAYLMGRIESMSSVLWGYEYGLVLSFFSVALMYPVILRFGSEKSEMILLISAFVAIAVMLIIALILSPVTDGMNLRHPLTGLVSMIVSIVLFGISFWISLYIHKRKEF